MNESKKILVDWGGTIVRDESLFETIAERSGNTKTKWESPNSWNNIRSIGATNYFDKTRNSFFSMGELYTESECVISSFYGENGGESLSEVFLVFDNNPDVGEEVMRNWSMSLSKMDILFNGLYVSKDKLSIAKQIGASVIVDDDPRVVVGCAMAGIKSILMLRKWNRFFNIETLPYYLRRDHIERVKSNLIVAEDWFEVGIKAAAIIDSDI